MIILILLILSIFLPIFLGISIRNSRGVFILYFISAIIMPYGFYVFSNEIPSFLFGFIDKNNVDYGIFIIWISFLIIIVSSISFLKKDYDFFSKELPYSQKGIQGLIILSTTFFFIYILLSIIFAGSIAEALISAYSRVRTNNSLANFRAIFLWGNIVFSTICGYFLIYGKVVNNKFKFFIIINLMFSSILALMDGGRAVFLMFIFSLFFGYLIKINLSKIIIFSVKFLFFISVISYVMIKARYETQNAKIVEDGNIPISETINGLAYFDHFLISIQYAKDNGYDNGLNYLNSLMSFIPRDFYSEKAIPLSAQVRFYLYGDDAGGIPPGLLGEAYIAGGLIGLLIISIIYGRILNITVIFCNRAVISNCPIRLAVAGIMIPMIGFTLVRGGFDIGFIRVGIPLLWCVFAVKFLSIKL